MKLQCLLIDVVPPCSNKRKFERSAQGVRNTERREATNDGLPQIRRRVDSARLIERIYAGMGDESRWLDGLLDVIQNEPLLVTHPVPFKCREFPWPHDAMDTYQLTRERTHKLTLGSI